MSILRRFAALMLIAALVIFTACRAGAQERGLEVSELDALRYENFALRLRLHGLELDRLQATIRQREAELQAERDRLDRDWRARYGLGLDDTIRTEQGTFTRRPAAPKETGK